ncbi:hypothetical protein HOF92_03820 [bacterium]|jgi:hypothetical protein|nr:hypothetical protein [bacterium]
MHKIFSIIIAQITLLSLCHALPKYAQREGVSCNYCHVRNDARKLNEIGTFYLSNKHAFPYHMKPPISAQYPDSRTDPAFLKLRQRYLKKYASDDPIEEYSKRGKRLFFGSLKIEKKSAKNCASCHTPREIAQVNRLYPRYVPLAGTVLSLEQMQNYCIEQHLFGKPLVLGGKDSLSISAYINRIKKQSP